MHASRIRAYPTLFPLVVAALFSLSILSSSVITVEERERDRKLCRPIVALFKYQKGTMGQRERERSGRQSVMAVRGVPFSSSSSTSSALRYSIMALFETRERERQSFHKWWTIPGKRPGPTSFCSLLLDYMALTISGGNIYGKETNPLDV